MINKQQLKHTNIYTSKQKNMIIIYLMNMLVYCLKIMIFLKHIKLVKKYYENIQT